MRRHHPYPRRQGEEREAGGRTHRRGSGPPRQPRHALPQGHHPEGRHYSQGPPLDTPGPPSGLGQMGKHLLGRGDLWNRQAHQGHSRSLPRRQERQGADGQPESRHRHDRGLLRHERIQLAAMESHHGPAVASLAATFGRGAMTNGWCDIKNTDVILAMGGNPAENHPVGFKWFIEAKKTRNAKLVAVDPRFTRTAACADYYAPLRPGSDIAFLLGIIRYAIENKRFHEDYVKIHTNGPLLINAGYKFDEAEGVFSGFDQAAGSYNKDTWTYQLDAKGFAKSDPTLQDPNCVFQLLKKHVSRYTPEIVERICGTPKDKFLKVCDLVTSTYPPNKAGTITYALGWTQHSTGVQIIRAAAMLQLLLGNVGRPGGGVNAFRGHSNIQGATDMAGTFEIQPGYLAVPTGNLEDLKQYIEAKTPKLLAPSMNYWQNYDKFMVSLLKATYGKAATKENDFGYSWLPKVDGNYSWMYICDDMYRGNSTRAGGKEPGPEGFISFGMNPVGLGPNSKKWIAALSKLKW